MTINHRKPAPADRKFSGDKRNTFIFTLAVTATALACGMTASQAQNTPPPYKNAGLAVDARVADLVGRMTLEEKARQLDMYFGCEDLLDTNQNQTVDHHTHAKPDAIFDPRFAEERIGNLGVGSIHDLYPRARLSNRIQ